MSAGNHAERQAIPVLVDDATGAEVAGADPIVIPEGACTVVLSLADALLVGHSLRALAAAREPNAGTVEIFGRVGEQLISAAYAHAPARSQTSSRGRR